MTDGQERKEAKSDTQGQRMLLRSLSRLLRAQDPVALSKRIASSLRRKGAGHEK